jgi:hypothetical protein
MKWLDRLLRTPEKPGPSITTYNEVLIQITKTSMMILAEDLLDACRELDMTCRPQRREVVKAKVERAKDEFFKAFFKEHPWVKLAQVYRKPQGRHGGYDYYAQIFKPDLARWPAVEKGEEVP